ncbi:MAG: hypothetical protein KDJ82_00720 [Rhodobacteraceae bacterium]|nr:hypothetical protein [Paracoccaceae bacterium]
MEVLPKEVLLALKEARSRDARQRARLSVHAAGSVWPILRRWRGGFSLDAAQVSQLRGLVEIHEGSRHILTSLIVASEIEGDELICTVKRETAVTDRPALDFVRNENAPAALLPRL